MISQQDDGGTAFPDPRLCGSGMTLRDWFAGQALAYLGSKSQAIRNGELAEEAYEIADAMLKVRKE